MRIKYASPICSMRLLPNLSPSLRVMNFGCALLFGYNSQGALSRKNSNLE